MFKGDGGRSQFREIFNIVQRTGKQHQSHLDAEYGHRLLVKEGEYNYHQEEHE